MYYLQTWLRPDIKGERAFTLVELAIVLVIIGLIVSSVLVGQDLIRNAKTNAVIHQMDSYSAAVDSFYSKFQQLPGDFDSASTYILSGIENGDGNGLIATGFPSATPTTITVELVAFWLELSLMNLIDERMDFGVTGVIELGVNFPYIRTHTGGILAYGTLDYNNYYQIGLTNSASTTIVTANNLDPGAAYAMDTKWDDGLPRSGAVQTRSMDVMLLGNSIQGDDGGVCTYNAPSPAVYNTAINNALVCQLRILFS